MRWQGSLMREAERKERSALTAAFAVAASLSLRFTPPAGCRRQCEMQMSGP